jgi:hypothetical protein
MSGKALAADYLRLAPKPDIRAFVSTGSEPIMGIFSRLGAA